MSRAIQYSVVLLPSLILGWVILVVGFSGHEYLNTDLALTELQLVYLQEGRWLYFGLHSRDGLFHLGPSLFYALYPVYWLCGGATNSLYLSGLAVNTIALIGCVYLLTEFREDVRWAGVVVLMATAMVWREYLISFFNVHVMIWWMLWLILLCAVLARGKFRYLPWAVGVSSFVVQCHFSAVIPALLMCFVATLFALSTRNKPRTRDLAASAVVFVAFWTLPLWEWTNFQGVVIHFLHGKGGGIETGEIWSQLSYVTLPARFLRNLIPAGVEWVGVVFPLIGLVMYYHDLMTKNWELFLLGTVAVVGLCGLALDLESCPRPFWGYYFLLWEIALSSALLITITAGIVSLLHMTRRQYAWAGALVAVVMLLVWLPQLPTRAQELYHFTTLRQNVRVTMDESQNPPELYFIEHKWEAGAGMVVERYKNRTRSPEFKTDLWRWPFNLQKEYASSSVTSTATSMWAECLVKAKP
jgi:hypothetical protein